MTSYHAQLCNLPHIQSYTIHAGKEEVVPGSFHTHAKYTGRSARKKKLNNTSRGNDGSQSRAVIVGSLDIFKVVGDEYGVASPRSSFQDCCKGPVLHEIDGSCDAPDAMRPDITSKIRLLRLSPVSILNDLPQEERDSILKNGASPVPAA